MKKILLISNDKIYLKNETVSNENNDTLNIIEAIQKSYNIFLISRILNKKKKLVIKCKNKIKRFDLRSFLIKKKDFKILMISITPRNLFYYFFINIFYGKIDGYVYLRSNGHLEYKSKIGKIGYLVYDTMYNFIQKRLKIIKVSNNIKSNGKAALLIPSELDQHWLKKTRNIKPVIPKLLYFGRFKKEKGVFSLLNLIKNFDFKFKLTMAGDNNMFLGKKKNNVFFLPKIFDRNKIISLYDNHNIFVLPSYTEGAPKVILESLVRKRPIIIFKDIKHIKLNFKGIFVCDREPKSFRNKIFYILSNYLEIQRQMSKNLIPTKKNFQNKLLKILND